MYDMTLCNKITHVDEVFIEQKLILSSENSLIFLTGEKYWTESVGWIFLWWLGGKRFIQKTALLFAPFANCTIISFFNSAFLNQKNCAPNEFERSMRIFLLTKSEDVDCQLWAEMAIVDGQEL